ncbi:hypothetical protein BBO_01876 [Beauveria brongniartii RCEF 3172]|uniref:Uncharacterized protein n=1 Tax=Beauveria brongniartii RCEF 3172 TaxID=1081107 RepID=A0A167I9T1_9HYPO|nr:hypothetical protein BBO_01876 [Beauveria brongniartii RCEF 3172]
MRSTMCHWQARHGHSSSPGRCRILGHQRLVLNPAPKLALQVVLGVMAMCLVTARPLMRVGCVLPQPPCIITEIAALLANSIITADKIILAGSDWLNVEEMQSVRLIAA